MHEGTEVAHPWAVHPWAVPRQRLADALGAAARRAQGDHPVFVRPPANMPIEVVRLMVTDQMKPPGTLVLIVHTPRLDTVPRTMVDFARRRGSEPDLANIVIVTHASPLGLEHALRAMGHPHPNVEIVETQPPLEREPPRLRIEPPEEDLATFLARLQHRGAGGLGQQPLPLERDDGMEMGGP